MGIIRQLDDQIANMIAAGEVVERPMGIVKELVENAIDAGSKTIEIRVEEGGLQKITVKDDGCGMDQQDAVFSFERHATSKIHDQNDLWNIHTMGFRGEALPSIASVSKVTLTTSNGEEHTRVIMEYGNQTSVQPYPCDKGTEITIEGLFYRTPARLKHLKSGAYENSLIQDVVQRFAFAYPEIAFRFISNEHDAFRTSGNGNLLEVIYQAWGREATENAIPIHLEDYDYQVDGYIVKPNVTRASRNCMHVFLNKRMVRTYRLYKAIQDGYEDFIVKGRNSLVVLKVEMDPQLLDVNVHPSKWEVRISKEKQLEYLIQEGIRDVLKNTLLAPHPSIKEARQEYFEPQTLEIKGYYQESFVKEEKQEYKEIPVPQEVVEEKQVIHEPVSSFPHMRVIGQLHKKFILCETETGLAILDQHACQERVHYEEIQKAIYKEPVMSECLIPISIVAGNDCVQRVDEINEAIKDIAIHFEVFGSDTLVVREVPLWMNEIEIEPFLQDLLDNFRNDRQSVLTKIQKKKIATMACHHSIRFNRSLNKEEMEEVVRQLQYCENPYHCPHGRPTFVLLDEDELTKEFLR